MRWYYWRAVLILLGISAAISVISAFVSPFLGMAGLLFIWPWIAVHVKRFHDAGKTGWFTLGMVVVAIIVSMIAGFILPGLFGIDQAALQQEMQREIESATAIGDPAQAMSAAMEASRGLAQAQLLPSILATAISTGAVGAVMGLFKTEPNDNQYGPGPGGAAVAFT